MIKVFVFTLLTFVSAIHACAQNPVYVSFAKDSPKKIDAEFGIELNVDLTISGIEGMSELVVAEAGNENEELTILNRLPVLKDNDGFYLEDGQRIYNGLIRYYTSFRKNEIRDKSQLFFFAVDKSGIRSNMVSYPLNP